MEFFDYDISISLEKTYGRVLNNVQERGRELETKCHKLDG